MNKMFSKILIIGILVVVIAGGILSWQWWLIPEEESGKTIRELIAGGVPTLKTDEAGNIFLPEKERQRLYKISAYRDERILLNDDGLIDKLLPVGFSRNQVEAVVSDLNSDNYPEIFIAALQFFPIPADRPKQTAYLLVVSEDGKGEFNKLGDLRLEGLNFAFIPSIEKLQDVDGDGEEEIFLRIPLPIAEDIINIFNVNFSALQLEYMQIRERSGETRNAGIISGSFGGAGDFTYSKIADINKNGKNELVYVSRDLNKNICTVYAYEWDGSYFSYSENISNAADSRLDLKCLLD